MFIPGFSEIQTYFVAFRHRASICTYGVISVITNVVVLTRISGDKSCMGTCLKWKVTSSALPSVSPLLMFRVHICLYKLGYLNTVFCRMKIIYMTGQNADERLEDGECSLTTPFNLKNSLMSSYSSLKKFLHVSHPVYLKQYCILCICFGA